MSANWPPSKPPAEEHPMQALLDQGGYDMPQRGDIREGVVISVSPTEVIIDLGLKREGIVPANDLARLDKDTLAEVMEGSTWPVYILQTSDREGNLIVSLSRAQQEKDWLVAQQMMERNEIFEAEVTGFNAGGLEVPIGKLRGFVPASHISSLPRNASAEERKEKLAAFVGRTIPVRVMEVDRKRRRLILSERAARRRWQREHRKQLLDELQPGDERTGIVRSVSDFGAFIDLGGADGLVHVSELAWFPVNHPSEVVKVGQEVNVKVLRIDKAKERIGLSIKRVQPDPWSRVEEDYHVSELVEAVVTRVVDFGAFVRLRSGVEGLLHVTEMADITPDHPQSLVSPGDLLLLRVLRIEPDKRRIGLSLRQVSEQEWAEWAAQYHQHQPEEQAAPEAETMAAGDDTYAPTADEEEYIVAATDEEPEEEAGVAAEAVAEPEVEAVAAAAPEAEAVVEPEDEAVAEPETEAVAEPAAEAEPHVEPEAGVEQEEAVEAAAEAEAEADAEAAASPEAAAVIDTATETAAEPEPVVKSKSKAKGEAEIEPLTPFEAQRRGASIHQFPDTESGTASSPAAGEGDEGSAK